MKFSKIALIALSSIGLASSMAVNAINDKNQCTDQLCLWVKGPNGGKATLVGFSSKNKNTKVLNIPSSVRIEGYTYYIDSVGVNAFSNSDIEEVNVASGIGELSLSHNAFAGCSKLKRVVLNNKSFYTFDSSPFSEPNRDITFLGKGVKAFTDDQVAKLLSGFRIEAKDYRTISHYDRKVALFELAKTLTQYLRVSDVKDGDNALTALKVKFGTPAGYARLYRLLAIAMGVPENEILVASDNNGHYWNYVKLDNQWFNNDILSFPFRMITEYSMAEWKRPFFVGKESYKTYLKSNYPKANSNPSQWVVILNQYGYADEFRGQPTYENFDTYLRQKGLGSRN